MGTPLLVSVDSDTKLLPASVMAALAGSFGGVLVYANGSYPPRPSSSTPVKYIGPVQPTTWLPNDEWVNNA